MDNIIITSNDNSQISNLVTTFKVTFELKYFSILNYFLGIQIIRTEYGLTLTQSNYTSDILHRFNMHNAKPVKTPCCPFTWLVPNAGHTLIPLNIATLWELCNTWNSHDLILHLVFFSFVNFRILLTLFIWKLLSVCCDILEVLFIMVCISLLVLFTLSAFSDANWDGD